MDDVSGSGKKRHKYYEGAGRSAIPRLLVGLRGKKAGIAAGKEYKGISLYALDSVIACREAKKRPALPKDRPLLHMLAAQRAG